MKTTLEISLRYQMDVSRLSLYLERKFLAGLFDLPVEVEDEIMKLYEERYQEAVSLWRDGRQEARRAKAIADREAARPIVRITKWFDSMRLHHLN